MKKLTKILEVTPVDSNRSTFISLAHVVCVRGVNEDGEMTTIVTLVTGAEIEFDYAQYTASQVAEMMEAL